MIREPAAMDLAGRLLKSLNVDADDLTVRLVASAVLLAVQNDEMEQALVAMRAVTPKEAA